MSRFGTCAKLENGGERNRAWPRRRLRPPATFAGGLRIGSRVVDSGRRCRLGCGITAAISTRGRRALPPRRHGPAIGGPPPCCWRAGCAPEARSRPGSSIHAAKAPAATVRGRPIPNSRAGRLLCRRRCSRSMRAASVKSTSTRVSSVRPSRRPLINDNYFCRSPWWRWAGRGSTRGACDTARFPHGGRVGHGCAGSAIA